MYPPTAPPSRGRERFGFQLRGLFSGLTLPELLPGDAHRLPKPSQVAALWGILGPVPAWHCSALAQVSPPLTTRVSDSF